MALKKESVFDTEKQHHNLDSKIIVAFEKISEVYRVLQWSQAQENKISPIQLQILVFIKYHTPEKCKVGYMARDFNITKATISDSVKTLLSKGYLNKVVDTSDTRSFTLSLTSEGEKLASKVEHYTHELKAPLLDLDASKKEVLFDSLTELIYKLQRNGIIDVQRMCFTCTNYEGDKNAAHYCKLMKTELTKNALRMDCPEHLEVVK